MQSRFGYWHNMQVSGLGGRSNSWLWLALTLALALLPASPRTSQVGIPRVATMLMEEMNQQSPISPCFRSSGSAELELPFCL